MKLQDLMSQTLSHTFHSKSQPYNYLTESIASICTKRHYLCQALYFSKIPLSRFCHPMSDSCCKRTVSCPFLKILSIRSGPDRSIAAIVGILSRDTISCFWNGSSKLELRCSTRSTASTAPMSFSLGMDSPWTGTTLALAVSRLACILVNACWCSSVEWSCLCCWQSWWSCCIAHGQSCLCCWWSHYTIMAYIVQ